MIFSRSRNFKLIQIITKFTNNLVISLNLKQAGSEILKMIKKT